jgi:hypothetical protein
LYHIAIVETDWLFMEALADYVPPTAVSWPDALLPQEMGDGQSWLTHVTGTGLAIIEVYRKHIQRINERSDFIDSAPEWAKKSEKLEGRKVPTRP